MIPGFKRVIIGRPMKSNELGEEKLNKLKALAVLSSDALSSVAYGTEQILLVLVTMGAAALWYSLPISLAVLGLLTILILSYRQTIFAYPAGGGAYIVAKDNFGTSIGLVEWKKAETDHVTVMIPQFITKRWWHNLLHNQTSFFLRAYLFARQDVKIATVPYRLKK